MDEHTFWVEQRILNKNRRRENPIFSLTATCKFEEKNTTPTTAESTEIANCKTLYGMGLYKLSHNDQS